MNLLVIGNGSASKCDRRFFKDKHTVRFLAELSEDKRTFSIAWLESLVESANLQTGNLHSNEIPEGVRVLNQEPLRKGLFGKLLDYIRMFFVFVSEAQHSDFAYLFYYGNLSFLGALASIVLNKRYALYIRCDFNPTSFIQKLIVRKAEFVLANGQIFLDRVSDLNPDASLVAPMIDFSKDDLYERRSFGDAQAVHLLFVGRLERAKGCYVLLDAVSILLKKGVEVVLDIVGGGAEYDQLEEYASSLGVSTHVRFHGLIADKKAILRFYQEADLFVMPSFYEAFPRVLYEAMLAGLPIITTPVGSIPALMTDGKDCLFVQPKDVMSLVEQISLIVSDVDLRRKLSLGAQQKIIEYLDKFNKSPAKQVIDKIINKSND